MALGSTFLPVMGKSSCRLRASAGILNNTQCTHVPIGASGSSMMMAKDCVPAGGSLHASAGEVFFPVQVYFAGMDCPLKNASLLSSIDMLASSIVGVSVEVQDAIKRATNTKPLRILRFMTGLLFSHHRIA